MIISHCVPYYQLQKVEGNSKIYDTMFFSKKFTILVKIFTVFLSKKNRLKF